MSFLPDYCYYYCLTLSTSMSQPDPYLDQCVNCFHLFDIRIPNTHPRILQCQHNMCTSCLRKFISDFTKLRSSNIHPTGSKLTCTYCKVFSPIDNEGIDRFPVNNKLLSYLENVQAVNELEHNAIARERALGKWENSLTKDSASLHSVASNGLADMKQHHQILSQQLTDEYNYSVHTFTQRCRKIEKRFTSEISLIQKQRDDIGHFLRNRDVTSGSNTHHFRKSIFDSESLITKLIQYSNLSELDNLSSIVNSFTAKSIGIHNSTPKLPAIHTAQAPCTPREHLMPNELSRSFDRSSSQTHFTVNTQHLYDCTSSRVTTAPDVSYRQGISPVAWMQIPTPPKQQLHPTKSYLSPMRACLSPTKSPLSPTFSPCSSNNSLTPQVSPHHNSPVHSQTSPFMPPIPSLYAQPLRNSSHKPTLRAHQYY